MGFLDVLLGFLPVLAGSVATRITEVVKDVVESGASKVPAKLKPVLNVVFSALVGGLASVVLPGVSLADGATLGGLSGVAASSGFKVGKQS